MRGILIASVLAGAGGVAAAQPATVTTTTTTTTTTVTFDPPVTTPAEAPVREAPTTVPADRAFRLAIAVGVARGFDTKDDCEGACPGFEAEIGAAIRPRLLALIAISAIQGVDDDARHHEETLTLQYWPRDRLWIEAGAGLGTPRTPEYATTMSTGLVPSVTAAIGDDGISTAHRSLDVQLRFASSVSDVHHTAYLALLVGAAFN